jgi:hypothetical protein
MWSADGACRPFGSGFGVRAVRRSLLRLCLSSLATLATLYLERYYGNLEVATCCRARLYDVEGPRDGMIKV